MPTIRILIVDDMSQVRQDLGTVLPLAGAACGTQLEIVGEAADGQEAIQQAQALHPDAVLMDLAMPGMDGWTAALQIKGLLPFTQVIALTVHNDPESQQKAAQAGMDGFIVKGSPVNEIIRAICQKNLD